MKVNIKRLNELAVKPTYAKDGDAGQDLTATSIKFDKDGNVVYGTGLAFEIPKGFVGLLFPRSSNAKKDLISTNSVGVIDSGYRGEVLMKFKPASSVWSVGQEEEETEWNNSEMYVDLPPACDFRHYEVGDRIAQIIIIPRPEIEFVEVYELSETERGAGGYGSSGK